MRVKQWRMPEPMNLWESRVRGPRVGPLPPPPPHPPPPPSAYSRREAEDDTVLPDDPGAENLADGMVPGLRGPLRQGLQLCWDRGTQDRAGTIPPPRHCGFGEGAQRPHCSQELWGHIPSRRLSWRQELSSEPGLLFSASACRVFLAFSSCRVASSQRGDSGSSAGHLEHKCRHHGVLQGPGSPLQL